MKMPTKIQDLIEQNVASGGFYDKLGDPINWVVPPYLMDVQKGLWVYLKNLDYKSGKIFPEDSREKRRNTYIVFDENFGMMMETNLGKPQLCKLQEPAFMSFYLS